MRALFLVCRQPPFHISFCVRESALVPSSSCEVVNPIIGPHPHDLICNQLPPKGSISSTIALGVRMSTYGLSVQFSSVQSLSHVLLFVTP